MNEIQLLPWSEIGHVLSLLAFGFSVLAAGIGFSRRGCWKPSISSGRPARDARGGPLQHPIDLDLGACLPGARFFRLNSFWQNSSTQTPLFYMLTGIWGGQSGSLLFWSWLMAVFTAISLLRPWRAHADLIPHFTAVCAIVTGFFLFLASFIANPFELLEVMPTEGNGLNPLLQHPGMPSIRPRSIWVSRA